MRRHPKDELLLTPEEVAQLVRKRVDSLTNERSRGEGLPFIKVGGSIRYRADEVAEALEDGTAGFRWVTLEKSLASYGMEAREVKKLVEHLKRAFALRR